MNILAEDGPGRRGAGEGVLCARCWKGSCDGFIRDVGEGESFTTGCYVIVVMRYRIKAVLEILSIGYGLSRTDGIIGRSSYRKDTVI